LSVRRELRDTFADNSPHDHAGAGKHLWKGDVRAVRYGDHLDALVELLDALNQRELLSEAA
jgi:hypothetical protein